MERWVTTREANQGFSRLAREVENGRPVTVTRDGRPVLRMVPIEQSSPPRTVEQEEALRQMKLLWAEFDARGDLPIHPEPAPPKSWRDEIYDDRVEELWARRKRDG